MVDGWPKRGKTDASGHQYHILSSRLLKRPAGAEGTSDAHHLPRLFTNECLAGLPNRAHRVDQTARLIRVAADRDGHLAHAKQVEHAELSRGERGALHALAGFQHYRGSIARLFRHLPDLVEIGEHR